jgi:undecaprenyl phosphate N,N'-diacetylbacillosamine 1-phosphate transferase
MPYNFQKMITYQLFWKRLFDCVVSAIGCALLFPLFLLITIVLCFSNRGRPFFTQARPGKGEKIFLLIKFRTMNSRKDESGNLLTDEFRLTSIGKFIRSTSLDEIPQLINVLKGDMSLIGPRPLLVSYLNLYNKQQKRRHEVRPGITGWAQVNGRNAISWPQKFKLDVWYVENISLRVDLKILFLTCKRFFKPEGISQKGYATMPFFLGSEDV